VTRTAPPVPGSGAPVLRVPDPPGWNAPYNPNISYHDTVVAPQLARERAARAASAPQLRAKGAGVLSSIYNTPQALRTAYVLSMLGAGGLGAKYMYDRTKELTKGENLAKAQASRARLKGLPPVWVDPDSLAQVKQLAESDE
jgi:hypothetical protein